MQRLSHAATRRGYWPKYWPKSGLRSPSRSVTPLTLEGGNRLAGLDHDRRRLPAATTLPDDFGGKFQDRLIGCGHSLLSLGPELGLAECRSSTSLFHWKSIIPNVDSRQYAPEFPNLRPSNQTGSKCHTNLESAVRMQKTTDRHAKAAKRVHIVLTGKLTPVPATLLNRSATPTFKCRVSAERIGLVRESGLADDLLQNPIL